MFLGKNVDQVFNGRSFRDCGFQRIFIFEQNLQSSLKFTINLHYKSIMDYEEKQKLYTEIKNALDKKIQMPVQEVLTKTGLDEERMKAFLASNLVYV